MPPDPAHPLFRVDAGRATAPLDGARHCPERTHGGIGEGVPAGESMPGWPRGSGSPTRVGRRDAVASVNQQVWSCSKQEQNQKRIMTSIRQGFELQVV